MFPKSVSSPPEKILVYIIFNIIVHGCNQAKNIDWEYLYLKVLI